MILRRLGGGLLSTGQLLSIVVLAIAGGLTVWAALPLALGWSAHAVVTGSMSPQVRVGDVLVSDQVPAAQLRPGMVVLFKDPAAPERVLSHRIRSIAADGSLTTQGDANPTADPGTVPLDNVIGVARLRVPGIGYPAVWFGNGRYDLVFLTLFGLTGAAALAVWPDAEDAEESDDAVAERWPWLAHLRTP